jgi:hypothetical protein
MWAAHASATDSPSLRRDDPSTWPDENYWDGVVTDPEILATFTPEYLSAAHVLAAANAQECLFPVAIWHNASKPPPDIRGTKRGYPHAINKFPLPDGDEDGEAYCAPHCDYGDTGNKGWRVNPQPIPIQVLTYFDGSGKAGGGNTLCWPGAHRALARRYLEDSAGAFNLGLYALFIRWSLRSTAQPLYSRFPIIISSCFSKATIGFIPTNSLVQLSMLYSYLNHSQAKPAFNTKRWIWKFRRMILITLSIFSFRA